jgi:hypothetical protein
MAAQYFKEEELRQQGMGKFYPPNVMGYHHMIISESKHGLRVTGYDSSGEQLKSVIVADGETLGYERGNVWVIPDHRNVNDPIMACLIKNKIKKSMLTFVSGWDELPDNRVDVHMGKKAGEELWYQDSVISVYVSWRIIRGKQTARFSRIFVISGMDPLQISERIDKVWQLRFDLA